MLQRYHINCRAHLLLIRKLRLYQTFTETSVSMSEWYRGMKGSWAFKGGGS